MREPIRILSDVHVGHPASLVRAPGDLQPLFRGAGTVVFNGDAVELRFRRHRERGKQDAVALREAVEAEDASAIFLNGNHDPGISELNLLDLCGGSVLVTHGDALFLGISPWSTKAEQMRAAHRHELEKLGPDGSPDLEQLLAAAKRAAASLEMFRPRVRRSVVGRIVRYLGDMWPPRRPWAVLRVWLEMPGRAARMAEEHRPHARVVLIGHVHRSGIWHIPPRHVVNTGSFLPWLGRSVAEIEGRSLTVRRIEDTPDGFAPGRAIARLRL